MAEIAQEDFVTGPHGVRRPKRSTLGFHGRMTDWTKEQNPQYHQSLYIMARKGITKEHVWAEAMGMEMHSEEWLLLTKRLDSVGFVVVVRTEWDSLKSDWRKLADDEKRVKLTANGAHFASQTFEQCMREVEVERGRG